MSSSPGRRGRADSAGAVRDFCEQRGPRYLGFIAVSSGMGGAATAETASRATIQELEKRLDPVGFESADAFDDTADKALWSAFHAVNAHIYHLEKTSEEKAGMGAVLSCALIGGGKAHIAHVGNCHAYLITRRGMKQVITHEHTVAGDMVARGEISVEEAFGHEQSTVITRAIGYEPRIEIDIMTTPIGGGDALLMCTDSLTAHVERDEIEAAILAVSDTQAACEALVETAIERGSQRGVTAVAWRMPELLSSRGRIRSRGAGAPRKIMGLPIWFAVLLVAIVIAAGFGVGWGVGMAGRRNSGHTSTSSKTSPSRSNPRSTPSAPVQPVTSLVPGDLARVNLSGKSVSVALKDAPNGNPAGDVHDGWEVKVVSGPHSDTSGNKWYVVDVTDSRLTGPALSGYIGAEFLQHL